MRSNQSAADRGHSVPSRESGPSGPDHSAATHKVGPPVLAVAIAPPPHTTLRLWRRALWLRWFGFAIAENWHGKRPDASLYCDLRAHERDVWLLAVARLLDYNPRPRPDELHHAIESVTGCHPQSHTVTSLYGRYKATYGNDDGLRPHGLRQAPIVLATPGSPRLFRSQWERRTAEALTRLGVGWDYESDTFHWRSARNTSHEYTPDFRLLDFSDTYVEVKGPAGASAPDTIKMQRVMAAHPYLTLLLWDPFAIEYLEDATDSQAVLDLLRGTVLAA